MSRYYQLKVAIPGRYTKFYLLIILCQIKYKNVENKVRFPHWKYVEKQRLNFHIEVKVVIL